MESFLSWSEEAKTRFPNLVVCIGSIRDVRVERQFAEAEKLKKSIITKMRQNYSAELLKDDSTVRAYRDLYWSLGIDPTKTRPSGEALLRRILHENDVPSISNVVDAYNLASLETIIPLSGFDQDLVFPPIQIRFSNEKDEFKGIGMDKPARLLEKVLLVADRKQILCIYPYRDADATKITEKTRNVLIIGYGAPSTNKTQLIAAVEKALTYIEKVAGGKKETVNVFQSNQQL
jgi:DNA/RNA-binding domain of Phe-tRNA-synthetase-like protein